MHKLAWELSHSNRTGLSKCGARLCRHFWWGVSSHNNRNRWCWRARPDGAIPS